MVFTERVRTTLLSAHGLEGVEVCDEAGKRLGEVGHVLFHPSEPRVVGYQVERPRLWKVVKRPPVFLALDSAVPREKRVTVDVGGRDAWGKRAAKRLGIDWDKTVIWRHMPVITASGEQIGTARDIIFAPDGPVRRVELSEGMTSDAALGRREIPAELVRGFDGESVRVDDAAKQAEFAGGAAAVAGRGTAVAADVAVRAGEAAGKAAGKAAAYGKAAAKVAAESETGKKAIGWLKRATDATIDAMKAPDDDDD